MSPARARAKRGEGVRLRDEILAATEDLLLETGSEEAVSIRAVADAVGVTAPSIYRHFSDKNSLLYEVCDRQFERLHRHLDAVMEQEPDAASKLQACGRAYVEFGLAHPEHYRIMFMGHSDWTPEQYTDEILAEQGAFMGLVDVVAEVIAECDSDLEPFETAVVVWTAVHGVTSLLISKPNFPWPPVDVVVDQCCGALLRGLFGQE